MAGNRQVGERFELRTVAVAEATAGAGGRSRQSGAVVGARHGRGEHVRGPVGECARRRRGRGGGKAEADGLTDVAGAQGGEAW